ncbi:FimV/HubP family polar landmark protein [Shewanella maritima]|uniref:FimV/HubP family polar landmark protein n=1 Tax=Shewanella maritima TaxID=2520507 RepID=UPI00373641C2
MTFRTSYLAGVLLCTSVMVTTGIAIQSVQAESLKITGPNGEVRQDPARQYGPTTSRDTFWSIALKVRPDPSITVYQVMSALFDANPHAFSGNNYNTLEKDMVLIVPSADVMAAIPKAEAKRRAELDDQRNNRVSSTAATQPIVPAATENTQVSPVPQGQANAQKPSNTQPQTPTKPSLEKPLQIAKPSENANKPAIEQGAELTRINELLDAEQSKNLMLTDELARAQDQIMVSENDMMALRRRIDEQARVISGLEENLQLLREKHQQLDDQHQAMIAASVEPVEVDQPSDLWRTITSSTLMLIAIAALPLLIIFAIVFFLLRRKKKQQEADTVAEQQSQTETVAETAAVDETALDLNDNEDDLSDLAIHLDDEDKDEQSIDDLLDVDNIEMTPEADLSEELDTDVVLTEEDGITEDDETTSLDDLWAEAMDEQDHELESSADDSDDLDSLLDGLEDDTDTSETSEADMEDLLSEFDLPSSDADAEATSADTSSTDELTLDLDENLTGSEEPLAQDESEPSAQGESEPSATGESEPSALDKTETEAELETSSNDESDLTLDLNTDETQTDSTVDTSDVDDLLAEFDMATDDEAEAKADDIASDTEAAAQLDVELTQEFDEMLGEEQTNDDVDALLAELETPVDENVSDTPELDKVIAQELDAELSEIEPDEETVAEGDIDALLADLDAAEEDPISKELDEELAQLDSGDENQDLDALLADLDVDLAKDDTQSDSVTGLDQAVSATEDAAETQLASDIDIDALLTEQANTVDEPIDDVAELSASTDKETTPTQDTENTADDLNSLLADLNTDSDNLVDDTEVTGEQSVSEPEDELDLLLDSLSTESESQSETNELQQNQDELANELDSMLADFDMSAADNSNAGTEQTDSNVAIDATEDLVEDENTESNDVELQTPVVNDDAAAAELEELLADMSWEQNDSSTSDSGANDLVETSKSIDETELNDDADSNNLDALLDDLNKAESTLEPTQEAQNKATSEFDAGVTDEDLLAAFSESVGDEELDSSTSEDDFILSDDKLTIDEALAALDEGKGVDTKSTAEGTSTVSEPDNDASNEQALSHFERENDFIDIDKLLNDADEDDDNLDLYKDVDVDVGEVDSLIGNADMVDVDDEENSVNAKLDLARAYLEIEDADSAKALLNEVQIDGNERQQTEAESLLKNIK